MFRLGSARGKIVEVSARMEIRGIKRAFVVEVQRQMICGSLRQFGCSVNCVRARDGVGQTALMGHVVVLVHWLVVAISENSQCALRLGGCQGRLAELGVRQWKASLGNGVQVVFFQRAGTALTMDAAAFGLAIVQANSVAIHPVVVVLLLVATVALGVGCSRLAQAATVRALRHWAAFFVDMNEVPVWTRQ